jgi:IS4 transposase
VSLGCWADFRTTKGAIKRYVGLNQIQWRRIGYKDAVTGKHSVFLTNNFTLAAKMIVDIYKAGWQVELFFKWIK